MRTFNDHLNNKLKDKEFKELYEEEKLLLQLSSRIFEERKRAGLTQSQLANRAKITQQQLSKIEKGLNFNIKTFLKVCYALDVKMNLTSNNMRIT
ncbi:MAG: helix-turn-helix domain-containing protein [bacterium]